MTEIKDKYQKDPNSDMAFLERLCTIQNLLDHATRCYALISGLEKEERTFRLEDHTNPRIRDAVEEILALSEIVQTVRNKLVDHFSKALGQMSNIRESALKIPFPKESGDGYLTTDLVKESKRYRSFLRELKG